MTSHETSDPAPDDVGRTREHASRCLVDVRSLRVHVRSPPLGAISIDARKVEVQPTGIGRTVLETLPLLQPADQVIPSTCISRHHSSLYLMTARQLRLGRPQRMLQPWLFGPLGSERSLVCVYDLIPLVLSPSKAAFFRHRLRQLASDTIRTRILTLTPASADRLQAYGIDSSRIYVASPGVDHLSRAPFEQRGPHQHVPRDHLLSIGRLSVHKGLSTLVEAWKLTPRDRELIVVLPPNEINSPTARRWIADGVRVRSAVPDDELRLLYQGAAAVCCPSVEEGYGLPLLEAAAFRRPVIASAIPAFLSAPVTGVTYVHPTSVDEWVEAIRSPTSTSTVFSDRIPTWSDWRRDLHSPLHWLRYGVTTD